MTDETVGRLNQYGPPTKYRDEFPQLAYKLCLLMGATDQDLADFFEVCTATISTWKNVHPEFYEALQNGKRRADMHIAQKLYTRAEGAEWTEDAAFKVKREIFDDNGKKIATQEEIVTVPVRKAAPPETKAIIYWLNNRSAGRWRDKQEHQHTGKDGEALPEQQALASLPPEVLIELLALNDRVASSDPDGADEAGDHPG